MCKMSKKEDEKTGIRIDINVTKIVLYVCFAAVCIVGIIFGTSVAKQAALPVVEKED